MFRYVRLTLVLGLVALLTPLAVAQAKRPMTPVDLLEVPQLSDPQLSPDGQEILFTLSKADWKGNNRVSHIWRIRSGGGGLTQLTNGGKGEAGGRWSPDGKLIAFLARRPSTAGEGEDVGQIFLIRNAGGEAEQLSKHATTAFGHAWTPDGAAIYFLATEPKSAEQKEREKAKDDVYSYDEDYQQTHLWKISVPEGVEQRITDGDYSVSSYSISRDGKKIVFRRAPTPLFGDQDQSEVYVMDASGSDQRQLTHNRVTESDVSLSPDNSMVLFTSGSNPQFETYYNGNLFLVPSAGGDAAVPLPDFPYGVDGARWSADGKLIYMICNMGVRNELFEFNPATRQYRQLTDGRHSLGAWTYFEGPNRHAFTVSDPQTPGEVHLLAAAGGSPSRVTRIFEYIARDFQLPREETIQWKGADGVAVEGILTYPLNYQAGQRYPLVVNTHGGPASSDKLTFSSWSHYRPVLAAMGYAVLRPNYRGSTGYGNGFLRDMVGSYFHQSHLDVMAGVDEVIRRGVADPDRMAKMGWSAGGHMTNKIITFTDRFKAASSGAGAGNWISMYGQSDVRTYRTPWFGGTPWQKDAPISVYWDHSPLKDVWKVKTPTLFLVGERDVRVPMPQSVEMYRALKSNGVKTHLYVAPREPHGWGELRHELFKINVELDWFEKHVTGRTYTWAKAPPDKAKEKATDQ